MTDGHCPRTTREDAVDAKGQVILYPVTVEVKSSKSVPQWAGSTGVAAPSYYM
jgi:hypothetical protein